MSISCLSLLLSVVLREGSKRLNLAYKVLCLLTQPHHMPSPSLNFSHYGLLKVPWVPKLSCLRVAFLLLSLDSFPALAWVVPSQLQCYFFVHSFKSRLPLLLPRTLCSIILTSNLEWFLFTHLFTCVVSLCLLSLEYNFYEGRKLTLTPDLSLVRRKVTGAYSCTQ